MKKNTFVGLLNILFFGIILILFLVGFILDDYLVPFLLTSFFLLVIVFLVNIFFYFSIGFINSKKILKAIPDIENQIEKNFNYGYLIYDTNNKIIFISSYLFSTGFNKYLGKDIDSLKLNKDQSEFAINERWFKAIVLGRKKIIIFREISEVIAYREQINNNKIAVIYIDKYFTEAISQDEIKKLEIDVSINNRLREWILSNRGIFKIEGLNDKTILLISKWKYLKSDLLNENLLNRLIDSIEQTQQPKVSISIGGAFGLFELNKLSERAKKALELSKGRGGNQITIFQDNDEILNVGEKSTNLTDKSNITLQMFYKSFIEKIGNYSNFIIVSHDLADIDAMVSAIGIAKFISSFSINVNILIYNLESSAQKVYRNLSSTIQKLFIDPRELKNKLNNRTGIFIVDISNTDLIKEWKLISSKVNKNDIYLIDHHTLNKKELDFLNKDNNYVDISASSTSEIISQIFNYNPKFKDMITNEEADLLISGIYTDSKNLTRNVSSSTYDVLSYLMQIGGNLDKTVEITKNDVDYIKLLYELLKSIGDIKSNIIFAAMPKENILGETTVSKLADELMNYNNIDASFVFARINDSKYKLSARSNKNVNVQKICEILGGGGHHNIAAVTFDLKEDEFDETVNKIKTVIKKYEKTN